MKNLQDSFQKIFLEKIGGIAKINKKSE